MFKNSYEYRRYAESKGIALLFSAILGKLPGMSILYSAHGRYNDDEFLADPWRVELGPGHEEGTNEISDVPHFSVEPQEYRQPQPVVSTSPSCSSSTSGQPQAGLHSFALGNHEGQSGVGVRGR